jgi:uncharacterized membrane protein (DUF106 family)
MFEPAWMEYFQREAPFCYYCILFTSFVLKVLFYFSYAILLLIAIVPFFLVFSGIKTIKVKLVEDKQHKKARKLKEKNQEMYQNQYLDELERIKKKKKHK